MDIQTVGVMLTKIGGAMVAALVLMVLIGLLVGYVKELIHDLKEYMKYYGYYKCDSVVTDAFHIVLLIATIILFVGGVLTVFPYLP